MNREKIKSFGVFLATIIVAMVGLSYASVPLYRLFCQTTGFGGTTQIAQALPEENQVNNASRTFTIHFNADVSDTIPWKFQPAQKEIRVKPGETVLAFYKAYNPTDESIVAISTYNVTPQKAGVYFNKIQCFCFEEQRLGPKEEVDMPVFFYVDPEFLDDPLMDGIKTLTLSYTFFKTEHEEDV